MTIVWIILALGVGFILGAGLEPPTEDDENDSA